MQQQARHVTTFVREATWVSPTKGMEYHEYTDEEKKEFRERPETLLQMRKKTEEAMCRVFPNMIRGSASQNQSVKYMTQQMKEKINNDYLSKVLIPDFAVGCRRPTVCQERQCMTKSVALTMDSLE